MWTSFKSASTSWKYVSRTWSGVDRLISSASRPRFPYFSRRASCRFKSASQRWFRACSNSNPKPRGGGSRDGDVATDRKGVRRRVSDFCVLSVDTKEGDIVGKTSGYGRLVFKGDVGGRGVDRSLS